MRYLKLVQREQGYYFLEECNSDELSVLADFLTDDVSNNWISNWKDWVKNPEYEDVSSNATFLEKEGDNIILGSEWAEDPYKVIFETTQKHLLEILDRWEELCKQMPKEIIIAQEGDKVTLEGRD